MISETDHVTRLRWMFCLLRERVGLTFGVFVFRACRDYDFRLNSGRKLFW